MPSGYTRYKDDKELFKATPSVFVNAKGEVFEYLPNIHESPKKAQVRLINGIPYVKLRNILFLHDAFDNQYPLIEIVAMAFKPMSMNSCFWKYIQAHPIDGNPLNVRPENIVRRFINGHFSIDGINYVIPGYTQYTIDKKANIINTRVNRIKSQRKEPMGSWQVSIKPDLIIQGSLATPGCDVSRLMALTFLDYDNNVSNLSVNHRDGNRSNISIENLEWVSSKENVRHGIFRRLLNETPPEFLYKDKFYDPERIKHYLLSRGIEIPKFLENEKVKVNKEKIPVLRLDVYSGEIFRFESKASAAKTLGIRDWAIEQSLNSGGKNDIRGLVSGRYMFFLEGEQIPKLTKEQITDSIKQGSTKRPVLVKNLVTSKIIRYKSAHEFLRRNPGQTRIVQKNLQKGIQETCNVNILVKYEDNPDDWIR